MAVSGNVHVEAGRQKAVAVSEVLRLAQKVFQKPRAPREQTPVVLLGVGVLRLVGAASQMHGELHTPALQLTLVQKAQTREREREGRRRRAALRAESCQRAPLVVVLHEARQTILITHV